MSDVQPQKDHVTLVSNQSHKGLHFDAAASLDQVIEAWKLVYTSYRRIELINSNSYGVHAHPHILKCDTLIIHGKIDDLPVSTLSSYIDGEAGLPLDSVYKNELDALRFEGKKLIEFGMFADRREHLYRSIEALLELMRWNCYFGVTSNCTDAVIGVHPHHVDFYTRMLGFDVIGEQKSYPTVNHHPVILLRLDWYKKTEMKKLQRGLKYFVNNPLSADAYQNRFHITKESIAGSRIAECLANYQADPSAVSKTSRD